MVIGVFLIPWEIDNLSVLRSSIPSSFIIFIINDACQISNKLLCVQLHIPSTMQDLRPASQNFLTVRPFLPRFPPEHTEFFL